MLLIRSWFLGTILCCIITSTYSEDLEPYQLSEYINSVFPNYGWNGSWVSDEILMYRRSGNVYFFYPKNQTSELFLDTSVLDSYGSYSLTLSPDLRYFLIEFNVTSIYRHSTVAQYAVFEIETENVYEIANLEFLSYATWSNNGSIAYVLDNNVYYIRSPSESDDILAVTDDGVPNVIYNGVPDWVYEEEVLSSGSAIWFSPNGDRLVFAFFNDTEVGSFSYYLYGTPGDEENQYPEVVTLRYPKAGTTNPTVYLKYKDLSDPSAEVQILDIVPTGIVTEDYVIYAVTWATNDDIVAIVKNRVQNKAAISRCNVVDNKCNVETVYEQENGWLDLQSPIYNSNGTQNLMILAQPEGDDTYQHLVLTDVVTNTTKRLTRGQKVVLSVYGWDESRGLVYYLGSSEESSAYRHVYSVDVDSLEEVCITCGYVVPEGDCTYAAASFSSEYSYVAKVCSMSPNYVVIQNLQDASDTYVWLENTYIREQLAKKLQPISKTLQVPLESGFIANVHLLLPPDLDEADTSASYPMVVYVYAGPGDIRVTTAFSNGFEKYITTNRKYIYAYIDGRGSSRKGDNLRFQIYRRMGTVEIEDQIAVTKYLRDTYSWIDPDRICIWGWSYGGFATAWTLALDTEHIFTCFLSVAPVTNFALYDTIYTERYMGLPTVDDNWEGYNRTDLSQTVESFRNRQFYLIHGSADDNVHYQNSMVLSKALAEADVYFYQQSYVDDAHSIGSYYPHLYHTIDRFFARSFGLEDPTYD